MLQIVPMENERGREMVEEGALCERKNGRGVDTNRNWEVHWGFKEKDYDPAEEFPGEKPFRWGTDASDERIGTHCTSERPLWVASWPRPRAGDNMPLTTPPPPLMRPQVL